MTDEERTVDGVNLVRGDRIVFCFNEHKPTRMLAKFRIESARPVLWECPRCDRTIQQADLES